MANYPDPWVDDGKIWAYYDVNTTDSTTRLGSSNITRYNGMEIDGTAVTPVRDYQFSSLGIHLVKLDISGGQYQLTFNTASRLVRCYYPDGAVISNDDFSGVSSLTYFRFPENVTAIGARSFTGCTNLEIQNLRLPKLTSLNTGSFTRCRKIEIISDLGNITSIPGNYVFQECTSLKTVILPPTLTSIGTGAFEGCTKLKNVFCFSATPPTMANYVFRYDTLTAIYVPNQSLQAYKEASGWSSYANIIYPIWKEAPIAINHLSLGDFRRRIMMGISLPSPLPDGAIPCESIYSDGIDTFIPTTFVPLATMSFEGDMTYVIPTSSFIAPFGYNISSHRYSPVVFENQRLQVGYNGWYWGDATLFPKIVKLKVKAIATPTQTIVKHYLPDGTLYNSQTITYNEASFVPSETIALMGRRAGASSILSGSWRGGLGRLKMYGDDHFGNLVADFIPCYYQNNFGMWDKVGQQHLIGNTPGSIGGFGYHWDTEGFWPNTLNDLYHSAKPYLTDDRSYITTRDFAVPAGCTQVQMRVSSSTLNDNIPILMCLDSSKTYVTWYSYNAVDRVVTLPSNTAFVRLSIPRSYFGDAWLKDYTHGTYIWKGINVI